MRSEAEGDETESRGDDDDDEMEEEEKGLSPLTRPSPSRPGLARQKLLAALRKKKRESRG